MYLAVGRTRPPDGAAPDRTPSAVWPAGRRRLTGTVVALGAVSLVTDISSEMVTAVLPLYLVLGLGLSPIQFGFLDGLYNGVTAFVRLAGGHAADRWQRHKLVAGSGYALSTVCKLGLLLAGSSTPALSAALAADRVGKGARTAPRDALISLSCDERDLGRAFGVHRAMDTTGAMLGPLVAFAVLWAAVDAYDAVFVVSFCFGLLGVLILFAFVPGREAGSARPPGRAAATLRETLRLFHVPAFRRILLAATALGLVGVGDGFLYLVLQKRLALDVEYFPLLPLGSAAIYLLLAVPLGRAADRIGRRIPYLLGHVALLGVYVALFSPVAGWPLTILVLVLHGTFYAATDGVLMALGGPVVPADRRAGGMALLQTGQSLGHLFASVGFGAVWTLWGMDSALVLAAAALAAVLILSCVLLPAAPTPAAPAPVTAPEPS
ncbi:MFS transporter [Streptomyces microflavus]|uniref:MFS transporter n=1 Tax=Streptomyces microflavus TaxID=1919 RepID=UPI003822D671